MGEDSEADSKYHAVDLSKELDMMLEIGSGDEEPEDGNLFNETFHHLISDSNLSGYPKAFLAQV